MGLEKIKQSFREATKCSACFENKRLKRGIISIAQPRWIGKNYFEADQKICVLMINPGNLGKKNELSKLSTSKEFQALIDSYTKREASWEELMDFVLMDMPNWGVGGKYMSLYFDYLKLRCEEVAFLNLMLCSADKRTKNGKITAGYNQKTMGNCFSRYTFDMLGALNPDICILSGVHVWDFAKKNHFQSLFPSCEFIELYHYAARGKKLRDAQSMAQDISKRLYQESFA